MTNEVDLGEFNTSLKNSIVELSILCSPVDC